MKKLLLIAPILVTIASAQAAAIFDDFNSYTPGNAVNDATYTSRYSNPNTAIQITANGALNNSQGWIWTGDQTVIRIDTSFDVTSLSTTASIFFQYGTAPGFATPQIGFTGATSGNFTGAGDLSGRLTSSGGAVLQLRSNNSAITTGSALTLTNNAWYQLSYTLTQTATADTFSASVSLFNATAAGGVLSQVGTTVSNAAMINAGLYGDTTLYAGVRKNSDLVVMDNFSVSQVPEPTSLALLFGGLGAAFMLRRRRS